MHPVKFTPSGVPYLTEFDNVSFSPPSPPPFCYVDSPPPQPRFPLAFFRRKPTDTPPPSAEHTNTPPPQELHGIHIQLPPRLARPQMGRKETLLRLQQTIRVAVLDAGMSSSPGNTPRPEKRPSESQPRGHGTPDALFCGTYGQLVAALESAGLSATPCLGQGSPGYTRLGALFVARNDGASVQLRKIALWG